MTKNKFSIPIFLITIFLHCADINAEIYKWVDESGVIHYSETKPENRVAKEIVIKSYQSVSIINEAESSDQSKDENKKYQFKPLIKNKKVVIYTTQVCGYCKQAKKYFKSKNIRYREYKIDQSSLAKRKYNKLNARGVPVIFVGKKRMNGFSINGFKRIYDS